MVWAGALAASADGMGWLSLAQAASIARLAIESGMFMAGADSIDPTASDGSTSARNCAASCGSTVVGQASQTSSTSRA